MVVIVLLCCSLFITANGVVSWIQFWTVHFIQNHCNHFVSISSSSSIIIRCIDVLITNQFRLVQRMVTQWTSSLRQLDSGLQVWSKSDGKEALSRCTALHHHCGNGYLLHNPAQLLWWCWCLSCGRVVMAFRKFYSALRHYCVWPLNSCIHRHAGVLISTHSVLGTCM